MLRFLFCLIFIAPVFFIPSLVDSQYADASIGIEEDTYGVFTESKIAALKSCEPESVHIYFSDVYVETHSAEFLHAAVDAASACKDTTVHIVGLEFENMTEGELALAKLQVNEVAEFLKAYETDAKVQHSSREAELDTRAANGRSVIVEFDFNRSLGDSGSAQ